MNLAFETLALVLVLAITFRVVLWAINPLVEGYDWRRSAYRHGYRDGQEAERKRRAFDS